MSPIRSNSLPPVDDRANAEGGCDPLSRWFAPARRLAGVGPRVEAALNRLLGRPDDQPARCLDLLWHCPHGVIERPPPTDRIAAEPGARVTLVVDVERHQPPPPARRGRGGRIPYRIRCAHADGSLELVFFAARAGYLRQQLPEGARRLVGGTLGRYGDRWQIAHPDLIASPDQPDGLAPFQPIYPLTQGLRQRQLGRIVGAALAYVPALPEWQDDTWRQRQGWPDFGGALARLHTPESTEELAADAPARRRLAYDELLASQLALALVRAREADRPGRTIAAAGKLRRRLLAALPFRLTSAQKRVIAEIDDALARPERMVRLLQGDVGSGKTLVATLTMLSAVEQGAQAALMAPTEVLARQHRRTFAALLAPAGIEPALLTGSERGRARATLLGRLADGTVPVAVGTHALFQDDIGFRDLGLVVIDEQHRFGVDQRLALTAKGRAVDLLVMTATPIPRTLVLALYGDLAVSELRAKPPGRPPIVTRAMPLARLEEIYTAVERALATGEQLYWVCPAIGSADAPEEASAEARHATLRARFGEVVGLVHGRLPPAEKDRVVTAFAAGDIRLLVATTVIEVGIDVPAASVILIEQAERFGLAQLHQLRGRVGRGRAPSACLLLYGEPLGTSARARLAVMRATDDGFRIAEKDLRLRGPGEVLGTRQSGLPALRFADLACHADLLAPARDDARLILARDPGLEGKRGQALRCLLRLFGRDQAVRLLGSG